MTDVFAFENCPLRNASHKVADRSAVVRTVARAVWPAARRAERVELSDDGIEAWSLGGHAQLAWDDVTTVRSWRMPFGRRALHVRGAGARIEVATLMPGYEQIEQRVRELATSAAG